MIAIKTRKLVFLIILLLGIGVMAYGGFQLIETQQIYQEGNLNYEELRLRLRGEGASEEGKYKTDKTADTDAPGNPVHIPGIGINFDMLSSINKDAAAWLYCPDTAIDYPIMKAEDYSYYLNHLPDGTKNANGSLFIDFNCAPDFSDKLTVIYGHNMKSGKMFGSLTEYQAQSYYEKHPYMYLYTEQKSYRIDLIYGCVMGAGQWKDNGFMYEENLGELLSYGAKNSTFVNDINYSDINYEENDRIVVLSTCSYAFDDARYLVVGVLRGEY